MTTVSLVECSTPVSLRTCGSSIGCLLQNRRRLKCGALEKKHSAIRSMTPHVTGSDDPIGRDSVSPGQRFSLEGVQVGPPTPSPSPLKKQISSPFCNRTNVKWGDYKLVSPSVSSTSCADADDFSDEDLDKYVSRDTPDSGLQIVGSKPKLHGMYDVPNVSVARIQSKMSSSATVKADCNLGSDADSVPNSSPSPENPPPSPVNFRPSIEGFVVGGRRILTPEKTTSSQTSSYSNRDFVPGFVKQPLHHCGKCEGKVIEEEQSVTSFNKRVLHYIHSRASPYRHSDEDPTSVALKQGLTRGQIVSGSADRLVNYLASPPRASDCNTESFFKIYMEKKRQKEAREREQQELQEKRRERKNKSKREKPKTKDGNAEKNVSKSSNKRSKPKQPATAQCGLSDLSVADTIVAMDTEDHPATDQPAASRVPGNKCQIRRCSSDIWPFDRRNVSTSQPIKKSEYDDNIALTSTGCLRTKGRITPFYPLPINETPDIDEQGYAGSVESLVTDKNTTGGGETGAIAESEEVAGVSPSAVDVIIDESKSPDSTLTSTVIVPRKDRPCVQWITFTGDNEPVLNNAPPDNDGCDNFLKRLQRSKLYSNSDPGLPGNSQFCFEAMVDKRYNRWKRRRRKKKESESRRSSVAQASDSSDNDDGNNGNVAIERIIDRMYDKINGCPPQTPGGTRETPRIRNRRRRLNDREWKPATSDQSREADQISYDASSEWTSSDKDGCLLSSSSGTCNGNGYAPDVTDDMCSWPYMEQYKQEMLRRISSSPQETYDDFAKNDWLPDINSRVLGSDRQRDSCEDGSRQTSKDSEVRVGGEDDGLSSHDPGGTRPSSRTKKEKFSYSVWSRSQKKPRDDRPKLLSRTSASNWSEMGMSPKPANHVGVVSVGENHADLSPFKAALRPIKHDDILVTSKPSRKPKEAIPNKTVELNLPALSKNAKLQTVPKLERSQTSKSLKVTRKLDLHKEHVVRPQTQPQTTSSRLRRSDPGYRISADKELLFRDYYLRSLYSNKGSHTNTFNTGGKLKKTITVDQLDLGSRRRDKQNEENPSSLSFTRSFTFSMFDLPDMYKLYNARLERKANGQRVTTESD